MDKELDYDFHYCDIVFRTNNKAKITISYLRAMKGNPIEGNVNLKIARFLSEKKNYKQAEFRYRKASMMMPFHSSVFNEWGFLLDEQGKKEGQEELFRKVIEIDPNSVDGLCNLGVVLTNKCQFTEAIALFEKALENNPNHVHSLNNLASVYLTIGEYEKAIERFKKAVESDKDHFVSYINLALAYNCLGKDAEAKENYEKTSVFLERYPDKKEMIVLSCKELLNLVVKEEFLGEGNEEEKREHKKKLGKALKEMISFVKQ